MKNWGFLARSWFWRCLVICCTDWFFVAQNAPDMFGSLLVSGVFVHIALQVIMNVAVVLNIMPNTGVTLPFISYGGTSILFLMAEMGLALSVARQIKFQEPEFIL
mgnify:FL=1